MRVFELARDLNIPSKELIERMKAYGFTVEGNFNVLDDQTIGEVKSKMLEPVSRVEEDKAQEPAEDEEAADQPRKRRIISARRSGETRKIKESLGIEGPLAEDQKTHEEVHAAPEVEEEGTEPESVESPEEVVPETASPEEGIPAVAAEATGASEVSGATEEAVAAKSDPDEIKPLSRPHTPRPIVGIPLPKPVDVDSKPSGRGNYGGEWRDVKTGERKRGPGKGDEGTARSWRDMKKERRPVEAGGGDEEWVRPRRKGDKRSRRAARGSADEGRHTFNPRQKAVRIGDSIRVADFAGTIGVKAPEILKKLIDLGILVTVNDSIESATAELVAAEYGIELEVSSVDLEGQIESLPIEKGDLTPRPPIVTIMGHVDHGKTTLLDYIRSSRITSGEAGGITQHIGAYFVPAEAGDIVFLDTPGHEAFTALRQRGANVTDLVVLIVSADDGVMPQTIEAIDHAQAAQVPIIVAMNKMDRPNADPDKIKRQLMERGLVAEEFGGELVVVPISAKTGEGVPQLLEMIHLQSEMLELHSTEEGAVRGRVVESQMDRRRGPVATLIVQRGTLRVGDFFVAGSTYGRVKAMLDDQGRAIDEAKPSMPVEILGFDTIPDAGDLFAVVEDEKTSRDLAGMRLEKRREEETTERRRVHLEDFLQQAGSPEEETTLNIILKADTQGSLEALHGSLAREGNERVRVQIIRAGVGGITETDVNLAATSNAVVIGFSVRPESKASDQARAEGVDIKTYTIIYELIDDVHAALLGLLKPTMREEVIGHMEVRDVFTNTKEGRIAGGFVNDGRLERNNPVRVYRDNVLIHSGQFNSLRRFKDDVSTVQSGIECGFRIANFNDLQAGDLVEAFIRVEEAPQLERAGRAN